MSDTSEIKVGDKVHIKLCFDVIQITPAAIILLCNSDAIQGDGDTIAVWNEDDLEIINHGKPE